MARDFSQEPLLTEEEMNDALYPAAVVQSGNSVARRMTRDLLKAAGQQATDRILKALEIELGTVTDKDEGSLVFKGAEKALPTFTSETTQVTQYGAPASDDTPEATLGTDVTTTTYNEPASDATPDTTFGQDVTSTTYSEPASDATPESTIGTTTDTPPSVDDSPDYVLSEVDSTGTGGTPDFTGTPSGTVGGQWGITDSFPLIGDVIDVIKWTSTYVQISDLDDSGATDYGGLLAGISVGKWLVLRKDDDNYVAGMLTSVYQYSKHVAYNGTFAATGTVSAGDDVSVQVYDAVGTTMESEIGSPTDFWNYRDDSALSPGEIAYISSANAIAVYDTNASGNDYETELDAIAADRWVVVRKDADNYLVGQLTSVTDFGSGGNATSLNFDSVTTVGTIADGDNLHIEIYGGTSAPILIPETVEAVWARNSTTPASGQFEIPTSNDVARIHHTDKAGTDYETILEAIEVGKWVFLKKDNSNYAYAKITSITEQTDYAELNGTWTTTGTIANTDEVTVCVFTAATTFAVSTWDGEANTQVTVEDGEWHLVELGIGIAETDAAGNSVKSQLDALDTAGKWLRFKIDDDNYIEGLLDNTNSTFSESNTYALLACADGWTTVGTVTNSDTVYVEIYAATATETTNFVAATWSLVTSNPNDGEIRLTANNLTYIERTDANGDDYATAFDNLGLAGASPDDTSTTWIYLKKDDANYVYGRLTQVLGGGGYDEFRFVRTTVGTVDTGDTVYIEIYTGTTTETTTFTASTWTALLGTSGTPSATQIRIFTGNNYLSIGDIAADQWTQLQAAVGKWILVRKDNDNYVGGRVASATWDEDSETYDVSLEDDNLTELGTIVQDDTVYIEIHTGTETQVDVTTITETLAATVEGSHTSVSFVEDDFQYAGPHNNPPYTGPYTTSDGTYFPEVTDPNFRGYFGSIGQTQHSPQWGDFLWDRPIGGFRCAIAGWALNTVEWGPDITVSSAMFAPYGLGDAEWMPGSYTETEATEYFDTNAYDPDKTYYYYSNTENELRRITSYTAGSMNQSMASLKGPAQEYVSVVEATDTNTDNTIYLGGVQIGADAVDLSFVGKVTANIVARTGDTTQTEDTTTLALQYQVGTGSWTHIYSPVASIARNNYQTIEFEQTMTASGLTDVSDTTIQFRMYAASGDTLYAEQACFTINYSAEGAERTITQTVEKIVAINDDCSVTYTGISERADETLTGINLNVGDPPTIDNETIVTLIPPPEVPWTPPTPEQTLGGDATVTWTSSANLGVGRYVLDKPNNTLKMAWKSSDDTNRMDDITQIRAGDYVRIKKDDDNHITCRIISVNFYALTPPVLGIADCVEVGTISLGDSAYFEVYSSNPTAPTSLLEMEDGVYTKDLGGFELNTWVIDYVMTFSNLALTVNLTDSASVTGDTSDFTLQYKRNDGNWVDIRVWTKQTWTDGTAFDLAFTDQITVVEGDEIQFRIVFDGPIGQVGSLSGEVLSWQRTANYWVAVTQEIIDTNGDLVGGGLEETEEVELWSGVVYQTSSTKINLNAGEQFSDWKILAIGYDHSGQGGTPDSNLTAWQLVLTKDFKAANKQLRVHCYDNRFFNITWESDTSFSFARQSGGGTINLKEIVGVL